MTPGNYLEAARRRLRLVFGLRGAAAVVLSALAVTAVAAWLIMTLVPAAATLGWLRVLLYGALAAAAALLVWWPQTPGRAARALEGRVPAFGGRLTTWLDGARRGEDSTLFVLLSRQTARIAEAHPVDRVLPARLLVWPAAVAVLGAGLLAAVLTGSHPWQLAAQRLWTGSLLADAQPRIVVSPGDTVVRRGSDVMVDAEAAGFQPGSMDVHAAFGTGAWERAPMSQLSDEGYGFVFVGVTEDIEYYVSARGLTSSRHRIRVADLARVTDVSVTYRFPAWTGLDDSRLARGDVRALPGTRVEVTATTDRPLGGAVLVVNGDTREMSAEGEALRASFEVTRPGSWHVAVRHQGELARISDTWLIEVAEDAAPEVAFTFPGHDRKATAIEEVAVEFEARDDYGIQSLALNYAVNGGAWKEVKLDGDAAGHVLRLEELRAPDGGGERALRPGDVISLYGEAQDHSQSSRTALYFVDVRPFDMRYRESQQMGGQGPSEGGGFDIAERQRDILSATWNLVNKRETTDRRTLKDEADVLAMLQRTLRDQVETLVTRSRARGLGGEDELAAFLKELSAALEHMEPAASSLEALELMEAVPAEQQALQHLVTAESSVRDVDVSLSRGDGRGTSGRSLGELIELEMDPERNRYEMPQQPSFGEEAGEAQQQEEWKRLEELAARQERLARQQREDPASLPSRWEQARLQRELEEMRRELESQRGSSGAASAESAGRALDDVRAAQQALEGQDADPRARQQASDALRRAAETLRETSRSNLEERLARAGRRVSNLEADQDRVMEALDELQQSALERARSGQRASRSDYGMQTFGAVKRRMQDDLADLRGEMADVSEALAQRDAEGARMLDRAVRELDEARVDERLAASAEAFEMGQPLYVIGSETLVEDALQRLGRRIDQARDAVARDGGETADPLQEVRSLRRRLTEARTDDGRPAEGEVAEVVRSLARLAPRDDGQDTARDGAARGRGATGSRTAVDPGVYVIRGVASENTESLYRMTLERLDLIEATLESADSPPIRAQEPRDSHRDSAAAARYFRELSTRTMEDD